MSVEQANVRRRRLIQTLGASALSISIRPLHAQLADQARPAPLVERYGEQPITFSRVRLDVPALAENGNSVPLTVAVDSPMRTDDHIRRIDVLAPANPVPRLIGFQLTPATGRAAVETRIRLADSQRLWVVCEQHDGALFGAAADIVVTLAACLDTFV